MLLLDEPTSGLDPLMEQQFRRCVHEATERGQTIFLSSHILSEVEELCARVGILRAGRLVEVSSVDVAAARCTRANSRSTSHGEPPDLANVAGVESVERTPNGLRVKLIGSPGRVLAAISDAGVDRAAIAGGVARGDLPRLLRRRRPTESADRVGRSDDDDATHPERRGRPARRRGRFATA